MYPVKLKADGFAGWEAGGAAATIRYSRQKKSTGKHGVFPQPQPDKSVLGICFDVENEQILVSGSHF